MSISRLEILVHLQNEFQLVCMRTCYVVLTLVKSNNFLVKQNNFWNYFFYLNLINEFDERCPLHFYGIAGAVKQLQHEMKEVGLSQVWRRLLCELDPPNVATEKKNARRNFRVSENKKTHQIIQTRSRIFTVHCIAYFYTGVIFGCKPWVIIKFEFHPCHPIFCA